MDIKDFIINSRQLNQITFESTLTKDGVTFGTLYRSRQSAPSEAVFEEFKKNHRQFFIEVGGEIIPDEIKTETVLEIKPLDNPS